MKDVDEDRLKRIAERKARWGVNQVDQDAIGFDSEDEDTDEEEDENAELLTPEVDAQIMKTIAAIRTQDPRVYEADKQFFNDEEIEKAKSAWEQKQKQTGKKITLKDYHRTTLLEDGGIIDDEEEEQKLKQAPKTHVQEQEEMKDDFKKAVFAADEEEEGGFFTKRDKTDQDLAAEEEDYKKFLLESMAVSIVHKGISKSPYTLMQSSFRITMLEKKPLPIGRITEITQMLTRKKHS